MATNALLSILLLSVLNQGVTGQYEYAAACIPIHRLSYPGENGCTMYVHCGPDPATITVSTIEGTQSLSLQPGEVQKISFDQYMFPVDGIENKAIRVGATAEIQVLLYKESIEPYGVYQFMDVYQVPRLGSNDTQFLASGYDDNYCGSNNYANQFYLISTFSDNTAVQVVQQDGSLFEVVLPGFGSFVQVTYSSTDLIASGTQITSDKTVNIVSGNICERNGDTSYDVAGTYLSNIPPSTNLAEHYLIPHLIARFSESGGYSLQVVASEDNTMVQLDGTEVELPSVGNAATLELPNRREWVSLNCSKPCLAVQYSKSVFGAIGLFMLPMIAPQDFYSSAFFTTLDIHPVSYLSLVVEGEDPGTDILLNGVSLGYLDWGALDGYATAETAIDEGTYTLESVTGRSFAAYVYSHLEDSVGGAGYALVPTYQSSSPPTTSPPPRNYTLPQLSVSLNGTVFTEDGEDMTLSCAQSHSQNLDAKTDAMVTEVNQAIGRDICVDSDITVVSGTALMITDGRQALLEIRYTMDVREHHLVPDVEVCSAEIGQYLANHTNWEQPIFPDVPGCSRLLFVPPRFDVVGSFWNCNNQLMEDSSSVENRLEFKSKVSAVLSISGGGGLDVDCTRAYGEEAEKKTNAMMETITATIAQSGCDGKVVTVSQSRSFTVFGDHAYFQATFTYRPQNSASFGEFMECALPVHDFVQLYENWGTQPGSPFLPVPPGCPPLEHEGPRLDDEGYVWACVDL